MLKRNQSTFRFDFVLLSYVSPPDNLYAYKLEGFDRDWTTVQGYPPVSYTHLDVYKRQRIHSCMLICSTSVPAVSGLAAR